MNMIVMLKRSDRVGLLVEGKFFRLVLRLYNCLSWISFEVAIQAPPMWPWNFRSDAFIAICR